MITEKYPDIINDDSVSFVKNLSQLFGTELKKLLSQRENKPRDMSIRGGDWKCNKIPEEVKCRQVEITGPANDTKLFINALNSDADVFMADIEDSQAPTWENILQSQQNFRQAHSGNMTYFDSKKK